MKDIYQRICFCLNNPALNHQSGRAVVFETRTLGS